MLLYESGLHLIALALSHNTLAGFLVDFFFVFLGEITTLCVEEDQRFSG